jgi:AcrR family transcriptional regulator
MMKGSNGNERKKSRMRQKPAIDASIPTDPGLEDEELRVRRTRNSIIQAFLLLVEEKGFEKMTVGDLAERAMINRATFYRHYRDKYDLAQAFLESAVADMMREARDHISGLEADICYGSIDDVMLEAWVGLFDHVKTHARLYRCLLQGKDSYFFTKRIRQILIDLFGSRNELLRTHIGERPPSAARQRAAAPPEINYALSANLIISSLAWWLDEGQAYSGQEMASWIRAFLIHGYDKRM